jgi:hypothetical protein
MDCTGFELPNAWRRERPDVMFDEEILIFGRIHIAESCLYCSKATL